jgi:hypothetical protein
MANDINAHDYICAVSHLLKYWPHVFDRNCELCNKYIDTNLHVQHSVIKVLIIYLS